VNIGLGAPSPFVAGAERGALLCSIAERLGAAARFLAREREAVSVQMTVGDGVVMFVLRCAPLDVGRLVGSRGTIIKALRARVQEEAARLGIRACVDVEGADSSRTRARGPA
jgi:predicted RNA-binding protein YlqC (UPF0109 family)